MKRNRKQLVALLKKEGLAFSDLVLTHEGDYSVEDADWNYKDVPHLHYVHELVEATIAFVEDDKIATLNMQRIPGLTLPLTVVNYQSSQNSQTYFTTWLFFVLIVETTYYAIGSNKTRVETAYSIGSPKLLRWCAPFIKWLIKRNYENLMSTDIPMRLRKGELRQWGYRFKAPGDTYSFEKTMNVACTNVIVPSLFNAPVTINTEGLVAGKELFIGRTDHLGVRVVCHGDRISIFPRMCVHEGAVLDTSGCKNGKIQCPWHGRQYDSYGELSLSTRHKQSLKTPYHDIELADGQLSIKVADAQTKESLNK